MYPIFYHSIRQAFPPEPFWPQWWFWMVALITSGVLGFGFGFYYCKYHEKGQVFQVSAGLSETEGKVLDYIKEHNYKIAVSECAKETRLTPSEVESALKSLSEKGFLARKK